MTDPNTYNIPDDVIAGLLSISPDEDGDDQIDRDLDAIDTMIQLSEQSVQLAQDLNQSD